MTSGTAVNSLTGPVVEGAVKPVAAEKGACEGGGAQRFPSEGGEMWLNRVYRANPDSRGRNAAHASSTRAAAPRSASSFALALQLVAAARTATWSAVMPPA